MGASGSKLKPAERGWALSLGAPFAIVVVAGLSELAADGHDHVSQAFYATAAQVGPVLGVALFIEIALVMAPIAKGDSAIQEGVKAIVRANLALLLLSEGAALYAVAGTHASAFLTICVILPWLAQLYLFLHTTYVRAGVHTLPGG